MGFNPPSARGNLAGLLSNQNGPGNPQAQMIQQANQPSNDPSSFQQNMISTLDTQIRTIAQEIAKLISSYPMAQQDFNAALVALASGRQKVIQAASQGSPAGPASPQMQAG